MAPGGAGGGAVHNITTGSQAWTADRDLDAIRDVPSFKAMLADAEARLAEEAETGAAPGS